MSNVEALCRRTLIIVVTYNAVEWVSTFLSKSEDIGIDNFLIIDNNSSDGTIAHLQENYPELRIVASEKNLGFGGGNNIGLELALDEAWEYVLLLNQDAHISRKDLLELLRIQLKTQAGIVSPMQYYDDDVLDVHFEKYVTGSIHVDCGDFFRTSFVNAAVWLLPTNTLKVVGGFDPLFHHYGEDNDYANRVLYHKLSIVVATTAKAYHKRPQQSADITRLKAIARIQRRMLISLKDINRRFPSSIFTTAKVGITQIKIFYTKSLFSIADIFVIFSTLILLLPEIIVSRKKSKIENSTYLNVDTSLSAKKIRISKIKLCCFAVFCVLRYWSNFEFAY